jgi:hypothetical protein
MSLVAYIIIFAFAAATLLILLISLVNYLIFSRKKQFYQTLIAFSVTAALMLGSGIMIGVKTCNFIFSQFSQTKAQAENKVKERTEQRRGKINYLLSGAPDGISPKIAAEFYEFCGQKDWWRIPLVYPYQMIMIDDFYLGSLEKYKGGLLTELRDSSTAAIAFIARIAFDRKMLLFQRNVELNNSEKQEWGIFEFKTGECIIFSSENAMFKAALDKDYEGELKLHSLLYQYRDFFR